MNRRGFLQSAITCSAAALTGMKDNYTRLVTEVWENGSWRVYPPGLSSIGPNRIIRLLTDEGYPVSIAGSSGWIGVTTAEGAPQLLRPDCGRVEVAIHETLEEALEWLK